MRSSVYIAACFAVLIAGSTWWIFTKNSSDEQSLNAATPRLSDSSTMGGSGVGNVPKPAQKGSSDGQLVFNQSIEPLSRELERLAPDGIVRDERLANSLVIASSACTQEIDVNPATADGDDFDATRAWAIANMIELCKDFDPTKYKVESGRLSLFRIVKSQGWDASASAVRAAVSNSALVTDITLAGQLMIDNDAFPYDEIMPDVKERYGPPELSRAWGVASHVIACERAGGCGPDSLQVAVLCARVGCQPNKSYSEVVADRMPASEYRLVQAMTNWARRGG